MVFPLLFTTGMEYETSIPLHRAAIKQKGSGKLVPILQFELVKNGLDRNIQLVIDNQAHCPIGVMLADIDHRICKIWIVETGHRQ